MYHAQVFEKGILNLLVRVRTVNSLPVTKSDVDNFYDQFDKRTLGQLLHEVRKHVSFDDDLEDRVTHALARRNDLAHQYFWRRAGEFMTDRGRVTMLEELIRDIRDLSEADTLVSPLLLQFTAKLGLTEERITEIYTDRLRYIEKNAGIA